MSGCAHCGTPTPQTCEARAYCCSGCEAAATFVADLGLADYYRLRKAAPAPVPPARPAFDWDAEAFRRLHVRREAGLDEISLDLEGVRCAACAWLVERALGAVDGVARANVNASTARLSLRWDPARATLSGLLARVQRLGYQPISATAAAQHRAEFRRVDLMRLLVAGVGTMQAMMFAEALYFGATSLAPETRDFMRWLGLLLAAPVVFYSGAPFLRGALAEWRVRRPGMDTLVAGSVLLAYGASLVETLRGGEAVYFDAAVMFVFLLLATRHLERALRDRAQAAVERLAQATPEFAVRRRGAQSETVGVAELTQGDRVLLRTDDVVPVDGRLLSAAGAFDESLLSGESAAQARRAGDAVLAGSVCLECAVEIEVTRTGSETTLALLGRLVERAQAHRPRIALLADRVAAVMVCVLLGAAALTGIAWSLIDPPRALPATLAVLAVSCPCALSLAVPAALAAVHARLATQGVLVLDPNALERLARVDLVALDKTGTLTRGECGLRAVETRGIDASESLRVAAALEAGMPHPFARAFAPYVDHAVRAEQVHVVAGAGILGRFDGRDYRLGTPAFAGCEDAPAAAVVLRGPGEIRVWFTIDDELREGSPEACEALRALGCELRLISGDATAKTAEVAARCGITCWQARTDPAAKLAAIASLQSAGRRVAMVGDGLNDAAVLARADVGIALAAGTALAQARAGIVLLRNDLGAVAETVRAARRTRRVIVQNLSWAAVYNVALVPIAAMGLVAPWAAALGMCASSLLVTLNAMRLAAAPRATWAAHAGKGLRSVPA